MRSRMIELEGPSAAWDPANPGPFKSIAGRRFLAADGDDALVRGSDDRVQRVHPGWTAIAVEFADGEPAEPGDVVFTTQARAVPEP
jgi:hypothetical protein